MPPYKNKHCRIGAGLFPIVNKLLFRQGLLIKHSAKTFQNSLVPCALCRLVEVSAIDQLPNVREKKQTEDRNRETIDNPANYRPNNYVPIQLTLCYCVSFSPLTKYYTYPPTHCFWLVITLDAIQLVLITFCTVTVWMDSRPLSERVWLATLRVSSVEG